MQLKAVLREALAAGIDAYEYYADMIGDRNTTLDYFEENGGVLVSIKCLDEGVDIPFNDPCFDFSLLPESA